MQVVEITNPGYYLKAHRGFLEVMEKSEVIGRVVLDDIEAVIISVPGCSLSTVLIDRLAQENVPLVITGQNYLPTSVLMPLTGKDSQMKTMLGQTSLSKPKRKRLWQTIVRAKIANQATLLDSLGVDAMYLKRLVKKVSSGDNENCEAQAARWYWSQLMGKEFRRDRNQQGLNSALNYCYAVVRASMARAVVASGLHPSFSLHHKGSRNPFNLVDDLMEPFRPVADWLVSRQEYDGELTVEIKARLAMVLRTPVKMGDVNSPLSQGCLKLARSLSQVLIGDERELEVPKLLKPIEMAGA